MVSPKLLVRDVVTLYNKVMVILIAPCVVIDYMERPSKPVVNTEAVIGVASCPVITCVMKVRNVR